MSGQSRSMRSESLLLHLHVQVACMHHFACTLCNPCTTALPVTPCSMSLHPRPGVVKSDHAQRAVLPADIARYLHCSDRLHVVAPQSVCWSSDTHLLLDKVQNPTFLVLFRLCTLQLDMACVLSISAGHWVQCVCHSTGRPRKRTVRVGTWPTSWTQTRKSVQRERQSRLAERTLRPRRSGIRSWTHLVTRTMCPT